MVGWEYTGLAFVMSVHAHLFRAFAAFTARSLERLQDLVWLWALFIGESFGIR